MIAIISLLVSILIPSLQKAKTLAVSLVCMSNLRNVGLATQQYTSDYDESFPSGGYRYNSCWWKVLLVPYLNAAKADPTSPWIGDNWAVDFACPAVAEPPEERKYHQYDYRIARRSHSVETHPDDGYGISGWTNSYDPIAGTLTDITRPFGDVAWIVEGLPKPFGVDSVLYNNNALFYQELEYRHDDLMNVLWADGHVSNMDDLKRSHVHIRD